MPARHPQVVFVGGRIYQPGEASSRPAALAVRDGRIAAHGSDAEIRSLAGPSTEVVDLAGGLLLPGFIDAHVHPGAAGLERLRCNLTGVRDYQGYARVIADYSARQPADGWVLGGGWSMDSFEGGVPTRQALDPLTAGRPAYLPNRDHHSAWVNTEALRIAGITSGTPDPADGRIERDADGEPTGALHEGAMDLVHRHLPPDIQQDKRAALLDAQNHLHGLGITGWHDAIVGDTSLLPDFFDAYLELANKGLLTATVAGALWWDRTKGLEQLDFLHRRREVAESLPGNKFRAPAVKIILDGVCETGTAALLQPYLGLDGRETDNQGLSFIDPEALRQYVIALDAAGFQIHFHALGDRAVRDALDAIDHARRVNGPGDRRHQLAHLQVVHPDDVPRFGSLGAVANLQALWACAEPVMTDLTIPVLGHPRSDHQYPFASIARHGGTLALGSDWPVSPPNPLDIVHVAVNRTEPTAESAEPFLPAERLTLAQALTAATAGSAFANRWETGTLAPGAPADLVVLDRDPFGYPTAEIRQTAVLQTFVDGTRV